MGYVRHVIVLSLFLIFLQLGVIASVIEKLQLNQSELAAGMGIAIIASLAGLQIAQLTPPANKAISKEPITLGINLGGAIIPLFFILYFSQQIEAISYHWPLLVIITALAVYLSSRVDSKRGIVIYLFSAIACAAPGAIIWGGEDYLFWAYSCAVLGTLIGGDLLHISDLKRLIKQEPPLILIGGEGVMDAIFLSGLLAMMSSESLLLIGWLELH